MTEDTDNKFLVLLSSYFRDLGIMGLFFKTYSLGCVFQIDKDIMEN